MIAPNSVSLLCVVFAVTAMVFGLLVINHPAQPSLAVPAPIYMSSN